MAAPSYVAQGPVGSLAASGWADYPSGIAAGDLLIMVAVSTGTVPTSQSGWTQVGSPVTAGGITMTMWQAIAAGTESGHYTISGVTGTTPTGFCYQTAYRASAGGTLVLTPVAGLDTDATSTAFDGLGAALPLVVDNLLLCDFAMLAPSGTYSGNATGQTLSEAGVTMTVTNRFTARQASNTMAYGHLDGAVTAIDTPTQPRMQATGAGANAAGVARFVRIHEVPAAASSPQPVTGVIGATKYGSAASILAGLADASDATGAAMSGTVGDVMTTLADGKLPAGIVAVAFRVFGDGGGATISARLYARDGVTPVGPSKNYTLLGTPVDFTYTLTAGESAAVTDRQGLQLKITQTG